MANKYTDAVFHALFPDVEVRIGKQKPKKVTGIALKAVAFVIAWRINEKTKSCFPSFDKIAQDACCSRDTAIRAVIGLNQLKVLGVKQSSRSCYVNGRTDEAHISPKRSNYYSMNLEQLAQLTVSQNEPLAGACEPLAGADEQLAGAYGTVSSANANTEVNTSVNTEVNTSGAFRPSDSQGQSQNPIEGRSRSNSHFVSDSAPKVRPIPQPAPPSQPDPPRDPKDKRMFNCPDECKGLLTFDFTADPVVCPKCGTTANVFMGVREYVSGIPTIKGKRTKLGCKRHGCEKVAKEKHDGYCGFGCADKAKRSLDSDEYKT
jgi:hypothetical protein